MDVGIKETRDGDEEEEDLELEKKIHKASYDKCYEIVKRGTEKQNEVFF